MEYHDGTFAGHFGEQQIYNTLHNRYWWQGMRADVSLFCCTCLVCASRKGRRRSKQPPLQSIPVGEPFEMVGVDILQLPPSNNGNQYVVVFNYLTKWPEVFAVANQKPETISCLFVEQVIARPRTQLTLCSHGGSLQVEGKHIQKSPSMSWMDSWKSYIAH